MSWQKSVASSGDVMAFPPYLTTSVLPEREWREEDMVMAFSTNELLASSVAVDAKDDMVVEMSFWWMCRREESDVGTKPCVAVPRMEAIAMELAEKSCMVTDDTKMELRGWEF